METGLSQAVIGGVPMSWREAGSGDDVLVLIHGFPFHSTIWRPQLEAVPAGWRVIAPDLRGFGGAASVTGSRLPMDLMAADIVSLLSHLGVASAVVCGHSMGGYVTFGVLRKAPRIVRGLVLADTRATPDSAEGKQGRVKNAKHVHAHGTKALIDALVPRLLAPETRAGAPDIEEELRTVMRAAPAPAVVAALLGMAERPDSTPQLRSINVPTQLIVGASDEITPPGDARLLARAIPGAQLEIIERAGHLPSLEQPAVFNRVLAAFLERVRQTPQH